MKTVSGIIFFTYTLMQAMCGVPQELVKIISFCIVDICNASSDDKYILLLIIQACYVKIIIKEKI